MLDQACEATGPGVSVHRKMGDQAKAVRSHGTARCCESYGQEAVSWLRCRQYARFKKSKRVGLPPRLRHS